MDSAQCRQRMSRLIAEQLTGLNQLADLLAREHGLLAADDIGGLGGTINERQRCVARLIRIDDEYREICRTLNHSLDAKGLEALLRWCDPQGTLSSPWAECAAAAARCQLLNDRNGAMVNTQLQHVRARLGTLLQNTRETLTYRSKGGYSQGNVGRVLAAEA